MVKEQIRYTKFQFFAYCEKERSIFMRFVDIIEKKKEKASLTKEELHFSLMVM